MRVFQLDQSGSSPYAIEYQRQPIKHESTLEQWCHVNPEILFDECIFIFGRQHPIETGIPDLLALDQHGNTIVIELKRGSSGTGSASEETVLSQPQTYASTVQSYSFSDLNDIYQKYRSQISAEKWTVPEDTVPAEDLHRAHQQVFENDLKPTEFNTNQRLVIVAEEITEKTKNNARFLLEQGLNFQCIEVQYFVSENGDRSVLAASRPVDYDRQRVRPERRGKPVYPERMRRIVDRAFPEIQSTVRAKNHETVFNELEQRNPRLTSNHTEHPEGAKYAIRIRPITDNDIMVSIDFKNDRVLSTVRDNEEFFKSRGFQVNHTRSTFRIVYDKWHVETVQEVDEGELLTEVATRYVELVEAGHEFFTRATQR